mmetsp:Transcript_26623/g.19965  ORF Transcript_26623/g.19965 Transcript_26623/m.19965 type:complete len:101 (-) Transcript_26623:206-508(-)
MEIYRDLNAFVYNENGVERRQMLDPRLFEGLREFFLIHHAIRDEESKKDEQHKGSGYRRYMRMANKFEEQVSRAMAALAYSHSEEEIIAHIGPENYEWAK